MNYEDKTWKIVRCHFLDENLNKTLREGLTLEEAREHVRNPETSSKTCALTDNMAYTAKHGAWFDAMVEE